MTSVQAEEKNVWKSFIIFLLLALAVVLVLAFVFELFMPGYISFTLPLTALLIPFIVLAALALLL